MPTSLAVWMGALLVTFAVAGGALLVARAVQRAGSAPADLEATVQAIGAVGDAILAALADHGAQERLKALELEVSRLPVIWKEEKERAERAYARARAARSDADRKLEALEDDGEEQLLLLPLADVPRDDALPEPPSRVHTVQYPLGGAVTDDIRRRANAVLSGAEL